LFQLSLPQIYLGLKLFYRTFLVLNKLNLHKVLHKSFYRTHLKLFEETTVSIVIIYAKREELYEGPCGPNGIKNYFNFKIKFLKFDELYLISILLCPCSPDLANHLNTGFGGKKGWNTIVVGFIGVRFESIHFDSVFAVACGNTGLLSICYY
jgi:hypothetical protein